MLSREQLAVVTGIVNTDRNLLVCGIAGSGKTYVLNVALSRLNLSSSELFVTAMTGKAADIIEGETLHFIAGLGRICLNDTLETVLTRIGSNYPALSRIKTMKLLVIDEVSLLSDHVFTILEQVLRTLRGNCLPFGGVRICLIGDFLQLPPVVDSKSAAQSSEIDLETVKANSYCFNSPVWESLDPIAFYLRTSQRAKDPQLSGIIEALSEGRMNVPVFEARKAKIDFEKFFDGSNAGGKMVITTTVSRAAGVNCLMLGKNSSRLHFQCSDTFTSEDTTTQNALLSQVSLKEKVTVTRSSRIMFLKMSTVLAATDLRKENAESKKLVVRNGTLGTVVGFASREIVEKRSARVGLVGRFPPRSSAPNIEAQKANLDWYAVEIKLDCGLYIHAALEEEIVTGPNHETLRRLQVPFVLSYAATAHKCQGSTFEKVHIAVSDDQLFEREHFYVMVSRVRRLQDLSIDEVVNLSNVPVGPREEVRQFYSRMFPQEEFIWTRCEQKPHKLLGQKRDAGEIDG